MSKKNPASDVISAGEMVRDILPLEQRMNNPNVSNFYGQSTTTFGPDGQATINQTMSPEMQQLAQSQLSYLSQGPQQFQGGRDSYYSGMVENFGNRMGDRAGFDTPSIPAATSFSPDGFTPPQQGPSLPSDPITSPVPGMGTSMPDNMTKPQINWQERLQKAGQIMQSENPLVDALMAIKQRGGR